MRERRGVWTAIVGLLLVALGFVIGSFGSAWNTREQRAEQWRKMHLEQEGAEGVATRTRVVFENPALALQAVEVSRSPEGSPELARVVLRDGRELSVRYQQDKRPSSLEAPDGSRALISYEGDRARVDFLGPDKKEVGTKVVTVPVELRSLLHHARADEAADAPLREPWPDWLGSLIPEARAQEADATVTVVRYVELRLDLRVAQTTDAAGTVQIEATCPPLSCVPVTPDAPMPGQSTVRVAVTGKAKRTDLKAPADAQTVEPFKKTARAERVFAKGVLPDVSAIVALVGVTASACKSLKIASQACVPELAKSTTAGAAIHAVASYDVPTTGRVVDARAEELYYIEQARASLDRDAHVQVCVSREGYVRTCVDDSGRPFGTAPMPRIDRSIDMRRGIGGTLVGSFVLSQQDGADCKFSPSPETSGTLRLTFDNEHNTVAGALRADQRGSRPNVACSLGTANMGWSQTYNIAVTQTLTAQQLQSGGKLPLHLTGTMSGVGSYSFSNCRTSGGASANCPAGKSDSYSYPVDLTGELDLSTQKGSGTIAVSNAPLATRGTWRIPAGDGK